MIEINLRFWQIAFLYAYVDHNVRKCTFYTAILYDLMPLVASLLNRSGHANTSLDLIKQLSISDLYLIISEFYKH